jgi:hypothetical protein
MTGLGSVGGTRSVPVGDPGTELRFIGVTAAAFQGGIQEALAFLQKANGRSGNAVVRIMVSPRADDTTNVVPALT